MARVYDARIDAVRWLLGDLADDHTDLGADPYEVAQYFLNTVDSSFKVRRKIVFELTSSPKEIFEELDRIKHLISNLIASIDNLPHEVRSAMQWGMWNAMQPHQIEELGLKKPPPDHKPLKSELIEIQEKLRLAVADGFTAADKYDLKKWTNRELVALMWVIDAGFLKLRANKKNPINLSPPRYVKEGDPWADFIKGMAHVFDIECTNVQRNWNYMNEIRETYSSVFKTE